MKRRKATVSEAERAVRELLSSWGVACNPGEWNEAVAAVQRAIDRSLAGVRIPVAKVRGVVVERRGTGMLYVETGPVFCGSLPRGQHVEVEIFAAPTPEGG